MIPHLTGKAAVVTGSSRGIGRCVALGLAAEGAAVVVNGRASDAVAAVVAEIAAAGGRAAGYVGSVAEFARAGQLIECCRDHFGRVDVLVNCAGIAEPEGSSILNLDFDAWRELIDSHLTATFNTCRHAAPRMAEQHAGSIVNTSSHAYLGHYGGTGYPAGKGGVNSLTYAIAAELREHGIRVNAVCPGARTRLSTGSAYEARIRDLHARGIMSATLRDASLRPADPALVAPFYAFLASDLARHLTGRLFTAAGGYVGLRTTGGRETPLAFRDAADGRWPLAELARAIGESDPTLLEPRA